MKEDNPSKIVSGFGGTLCLVVSAIYIAAFVGLAAVPRFEPLVPFHFWIPGWVALVFAMGLAGSGSPRPDVSCPETGEKSGVLTRSFCNFSGWLFRPIFRVKSNEPFLDLPEADDLSTEQLDMQVQKAQEQLLRN